ncbi:ABC transporter permease [Brevibacillus sp. H7]|uniref:ABC transporter permease n=1 Tax=Brevibacillus sp. H7 TaxID=3349138 RepID=UPI0037F4E610
MNEPVLNQSALETNPSSRKSVKRHKVHRWLTVFRENRIGMLGAFLFFLFALISTIGPIVYPYDPMEFGSGGAVLQPPSAEHWLGTDDMGRDVLGALISGSRTSLGVGVLATGITMLIGTLVGICAGYFGGKIDTLLMRFTEIFLVLPWLPLMLVLAALLGTSIWNIILVIGITSWSSTARIVRAQALSIKERQFVERARAIGASHFTIMRRHIFPNVFPLIFANTILVSAVAILSETSLSFLGMGDPTHPSWGMMLHYAFTSGAGSMGAYWFLLPPGLCVVAVVLGFTFLGYAFDELFNPKLQRR